MSVQSSTSKVSTTSTSVAAAAPKKVGIWPMLRFGLIIFNYYRGGVRRGQLRPMYRIPPLIMVMMMTYSTLQQFCTVNCLAKSIIFVPSKFCTSLSAT